MNDYPRSNLGDFVRAIKILNPEGDGVFKVMAELFGLKLEMQDLDSKSELIESQPSHSEKDTSPAKATNADGLQNGGITNIAQDLALDADVTFNLVPLPPVSVSFEWLEEDAPELPEAFKTEVPPGYIPHLLDPIQERVLLTELLSMGVRSGSINFPGLINLMCNGEPVYDFPLLTRRTLNRGVEILIDRAEFMAPFYMDQENLVNSARNLFGAENVRVFYFDSDPIPDEETGYHSNGKRKAWTAPQSPRPILLLTDFGILAKKWNPVSYNNPIVIWNKFSMHAREAMCPIFALVPYAAERWPRGIEQLFNVFTWNRNLNLSTLRRSLGRRWYETG